jgi:hypothetical protein
MKNAEEVVVGAGKDERLLIAQVFGGAPNEYSMFGEFWSGKGSWKSC